jgi:dsRNA-specific ribonuclease
MRYQMQVSIGEHHCTVGYGENKKKAKASAADNLLKHLGLDLAKLRAKKEEVMAQKLSNMSPASILSNALGALHKHSGTQQKLGTLNRAPGSPLTANNKFTESTIHELNHGECKNLPDKKRMEYAANLEKLQVIYNDFKQPDVNNEDHTCQLAVLCQNPVVFKGTGVDIESAREHASKQAIAYFSKK